MILTRKPTSRKGENGRVLIIAGSEDYPGAAYLAAMAALRTGVDSVVVAAPTKVAWTLNQMSPDIVTKKMPGNRLGVEHTRPIDELISRCDVFLVGNGLGMEPATQRLVKTLMKGHPKMKKVIDADAIKALLLDDIGNAIITPNRDEYRLLLEKSKVREKDIRLALQDNVLIEKGHLNIIRSKEKTARIAAGNPGMTVAGTGDVLAGICAGLLALGMDSWSASTTAVKWNSQIADSLKEVFGYGFIASDFLQPIACKSKSLYRL